MAYEYAVRGCPVQWVSAEVALQKMFDVLRFNGAVRSYSWMESVRTQSILL